MMRSLWAGVTGLQAHQIAMDVEGNNIANVNTEGYSKLRVNQMDVINYTPSAGNPLSQAESCGGVAIASITRYSDMYLQSYYWDQNTSYSYFDSSN